MVVGRTVRLQHKSGELTLAGRLIAHLITSPVALRANALGQELDLLWDPSGPYLEQGGYVGLHSALMKLVQAGLVERDESLHYSVSSKLTPDELTQLLDTRYVELQVQDEDPELCALLERSQELKRQHKEVVVAIAWRLKALTRLRVTEAVEIAYQVAKEKVD